jgi:hypothetical protein
LFRFADYFNKLSWAGWRKRLVDSHHYPPFADHSPPSLRLCWSFSGELGTGMNQPLFIGINKKPCLGSGAWRHDSGRPSPLSSPAWGG